MITPLYILIKTHQIVFNVKQMPSKIDHNGEETSWYKEKVDHWQSSHQTAEYASEEEREKILNVLKDSLAGNAYFTEDGTHYTVAINSGIVYTGDRIRIEKVCEDKSHITINKIIREVGHYNFGDVKVMQECICKPISFSAYLSEVKEEKEKWLDTFMAEWKNKIIQDNIKSENEFWEKWDKLKQEPLAPIPALTDNKEEKETQGKLWEDLLSIFYDTSIKYYEAEEKMKSKFTLTRK